MSEAMYENYPFRILCLTSAQSISSYLIGALIFYLIGGLFAGFGYILISLLSIVLAMRFRCSYCYYYGRNCASGLGSLSKLFFKKRDNAEFSNPKNVAPAAFLSFAVLFLPLVAAIVFIFLEFSWSLLLLSVAYFIIAFFFGLSLRKNVVCKYCKQGEIGCPAYQGMQGKSRTG